MTHSLGEWVDLLVFLYGCGYTHCHALHVDIRGLLKGACSSLCGSQDQIQVIRFNSKCLYPMNHLTGPHLYLIEAHPSLSIFRYHQASDHSEFRHRCMPKYVAASLTGCSRHLSHFQPVITGPERKPVLLRMPSLLHLLLALLVFLRFKWK